jgi:hypothetical protein
MAQDIILVVDLNVCRLVGGFLNVEPHGMLIWDMFASQGG